MAKKIDISNECECEKFEKRNELQTDVSKKLLEKPPKHANYRECSFLHICCKANCLFNHNTECESNGITVTDIKNKPLCASFLKK